MKKKRYFTAFVVLFVFLFLFLIMNLCIGSVKIPFFEIPKILQGIGTDETYTEIVTQVRAPRAFAAVILGGALALSGYLLQTFFHNPIATPFTLGIRFMADDSCGLCRFHAVYGICYFNIQSH